MRILPERPRWSVHDGLGEGRSRLGARSRESTRQRRCWGREEAGGGRPEEGRERDEEEVWLTWREEEEEEEEDVY